MEKRFIITDKQDEIQSWLDMGYEIEKMIPLNITTGTSGYLSTYDGKVAVYLIKKN